MLQLVCHSVKANNKIGTTSSLTLDHHLNGKNPNSLDI